MRVAILQARMSSSRLPGKVLAPVLGQSMISRQVERLRRSRGIDQLVVATSTDPSDDVLAAHCADLGLSVHRGDLHDVLDRFRGAAAQFPEAATVIRLTADCPLADPAVIDAVVRRLADAGCDYVSNTLTGRTFPHGTDCEALRREALERAWREAADPYEREHVTPYIYRHPELFQLSGVEQAPSAGDLRWTVDYPADLEFVRDVYARLYPANPAFTSADVIALARNSAEVPQ